MITDKPIHLEEYLTGGFDPKCGAVVTFSGVVRSTNEGRKVTGIFYDCYREMAEAEIGRLIDDVVAECRVSSLRVVVVWAVYCRPPQRQEPRSDNLELVSIRLHVWHRNAKNLGESTEPDPMARLIALALNSQSIRLKRRSHEGFAPQFTV